MAVMLVAAVDREKERWQHTATLASFVLNFGGMRDKTFRPRAPQELFSFAFDGDWKEIEKRRIRSQWRRAFGTNTE